MIDGVDAGLTGQYGVLGVLVGAIIWILRTHFTKADKREDDAAAARKESDARHAAAAEQQAKATAELAAAMASFAVELRSQSASLTALASEVRDIGGEVREILDDRKTPVQRPPIASPYAVRGPGGREG